MDVSDGHGRGPLWQATAWEKVRSVGLWASAMGVFVPAASLWLALEPVLGVDRSEWIVRLACRWQLRAAGCRLTSDVHGAVKPDRPYMFVQNHINLLDYATMYSSTSHFKQPVALAALYRIPLFGTVLRRRGAVSVYPKETGGIERLRDQADEELKKGRSLLVFPEGGRTRDGRVKRFRTGVFHVARQLGVEVVPVSVTGMQDVMRADSPVVRPGFDVHVKVGAPQRTSHLTEAEVPDFAARMEAIISKDVQAYLSQRSSTS